MLLNPLLAKAVTLSMPHYASYGLLLAAIGFIIYGIFGLLRTRPIPVSILLAVIFLIAGVLLLLGI